MTKGYIYTNGKVPRAGECMTDPKWKPHDDPPPKGDYAAVFDGDYVKVDYDDDRHFQLGMKIADAQGLRYNAVKTSRGGHLYFSNVGLTTNRPAQYAACGLVCELKFATSRETVPIRRGEDLEWLRGAPDNADIDPLPCWLLPLGPKVKLDLLGMGAGDGRNQAVYNHILTLFPKHMGKEDTRTTCRLINDFIFAEPLAENEVDTILRDESFPDRPQDFPHLDTKGRPVKHWENTEWMAEQEGIHFQFNGLTKDVETECSRYDGMTHDSITTDLRGKCAVKGYNVSKADMEDHIRRIAEKNAYHPVQDYLTDSLAKWDGQHRIHDLFKMFELDPEARQDPEFLYTLFERWLITAAKLAFNKGEEAAQGALVLFGAQGIGKTRKIMSILMPDPAWGKTGRMIDLRDKDTVMQALGYWIVELGEYGRTLSAEKRDHYKAFLTESMDVFRAPYARSAEKHPRTTTFYATTDEPRFLKDDAGERRNWVMAITGFNDVNVDINQVWGEVAHMALVERRPHWLTKDEIDKLNRQNEVYKVISPECQLLLDSLNWQSHKDLWGYLNASEMCEILGLPSSRNVAMGKALASLQSHGIEPPTTHRFHKYQCPPFKDVWRNQLARDRYPTYRTTDDDDSGKLRIVEGKKNLPDKTTRKHRKT